MSASKFAMFWAVGVMMEARSMRPSPLMSRMWNSAPRGASVNPTPRPARTVKGTGSLDPSNSSAARRRQSAEQRSSTSTSSTAWAMLLAKGLYSGGRSPALAAA